MTRSSTSTRGWPTREDPETLRYLEAENAYTAAMTAGQAGLREAIFGEIKGRTQETDLSVPVRKDGWWYYSRTVAGKQYPVHCRRAVRPGEDAPPGTGDGAPLPGEEILLDGNEVAGDSPFFSLGAFSVSPDGRLLAYSTDFAGDERFTLRIKDLVTGETAADEIPGTFYGCAWSADGSALFYTTVDAAWRPYRVWRHQVGTPAAGDVVVIEEADQRFSVGVGLTRSERYLTIGISSSLTSEVWLLDAANPAASPQVVLPRRQGVEYSVEHQAGPDGAGRLLILHNDGALNFELAQVPLAGREGGTGRRRGGPIAGPADLTTVIAHRDGHQAAGRGRLRRPRAWCTSAATASPACGSSAPTAVSRRSPSPSRCTRCPPGRTPSTPPGSSGCTTPRWPPPTRSSTPTPGPVS